MPVPARRGKNQFTRENLDQRYMQALQGAESGQAARRAAEAQFSEFDEEMRKQIERLRGRQAATGRLRSGYGMEQQDELYSEAYEDLGESVARRAGQQRERYLDLLAGGMDRLNARERADMQKGASIGGGIGSLLGGLAGSFLLPGVGTKAGAMIGGAVGSGAGQYL